MWPGQGLSFEVRIGGGPASPLPPARTPAFRAGARSCHIYVEYRVASQVKETLFRGRSEYQDIAVFRTNAFGTVLVLDGAIQVRWVAVANIAHVSRNAGPGHAAAADPLRVTCAPPRVPTAVHRP